MRRLVFLLGILALLFVNSLNEHSPFSTPEVDAIVCGGEPYVQVFEDSNFLSSPILTVCYPDKAPNLFNIPHGAHQCHAVVIQDTTWGACISSVKTGNMPAGQTQAWCLYDRVNYGVGGALRITGNQNIAYVGNTYNDIISSIRFWVDTATPYTC